ncbi:hypothetical protein [Candidatus Berkiella aquae]|uniref:Uncharacterized protein n=1 Tax=Candidatus Berkiella aquae TaxID=295108 RepID=A0A0Q9YNY5_9GAMM|nr:hypothetical protein [Candidatus Berkiella aquae]MCS5711628.1 hypothetical protein [Candidatus Berkiella aquae]
MIDVVLNLALLAYNAWEATFACIGVIGTVLALKTIWFNQKKPLPLPIKLGLSLFYLLHITAIFFATGLLGEALLGATMATLLVSMTSLLSDSYDYMQERYQNFKLTRKIKKLQSELSSNNIAFEQNSLFFEDVMGLQDEIESLTLQQEELIYFLSIIENQSENDQTNIQTIRDISAALKERCDSILDEKEVIRDFYKVSTRLKLSEYQIIQNTSAEIKTLNQRKNELQRNLSSSRNGRSNASNNKPINKQIAILEGKIKKLAIINQHFYKIKKAEDTKNEIEQELRTLDQKYQQPPFDEYSASEAIALKDLERDYLHQRLISLHRYISENTNLSKAKTTSSTMIFSEYHKITALESLPNRRTLVRTLENQTRRLMQIIRDKERELAEKQRYLQLIAINPNEQLPDDMNKIMNKARELIKYQNRLALSQIEKKQKLSATRYSLLSAALAIFMCYTSFWIVSEIFDNLMRFVGVLAGLTSIRGFIQLRNTQNKLQSEQNHQWNCLVLDCKNRADHIKIPQEQAGVKVKLFSLIDEMENLDAKKKSPASASPLEKAKKYLPRFSARTAHSRQGQGKENPLPSTAKKKSLGRR